jgi:hypothetical protein
MNKGHGERLSRKMEHAIAALLLAPTIGDAAKKAGVAERTLRTWLNLPIFKDAYLKARRQVVEHAISQLQRSARAAVATLQRNLKCGQPGAENGAAAMILKLSLQGVNQEDLLARLDALERRRPDAFRVA